MQDLAAAHDLNDNAAADLFDSPDCDMSHESSGIFVADHSLLTRSDLIYFIDCYVYCQLKKDATVAQTVIDKVVKGISNLCREIMICKDAQFTTVVDKHKRSEDDEVIQLRNTINTCKNPFEGFTSNHEVKQYYDS